MMTFEEFQQNTVLFDYYPYHITLNLTDACNLACQYCFVNQSPNFMSLDLAKQGVDFIWKNLQYHKNILKDIEQNQTSSIILFGGEPLLTFYTVIKPLIFYIETIYDISQFNIQITTNGTLLTKEIIDFFEKYNIGMLISFDGIKQIQDKNRPFHDPQQSSFDVVMENLENFSFFQSYKISYRLRITLTVKDIELWYKNFQFLHNLPIQKFVFMPEYYTEFTNIQKEQIKEQLNLMCDDMYYMFLNNLTAQYPIWDNYIDCIKQIVIHDYNFIIKNNIDSTVPRYLANACGYNLIGITLDSVGNFYTCREEPRMYDNIKCHPTIIGNIKDGINYEKIYQLKYQLNKIEYTFFQNRTCNKDCWYFKNNMQCNYSWCPAHTLKTQKILINTCIFDQILCNRINQDMKKLINNKQYIHYLKDNFKEYNFIYNYINAPPAIQKQMIKIIKGE